MQTKNICIFAHTQQSLSERGQASSEFSYAGRLRDDGGINAPIPREYAESIRRRRAQSRRRRSSPSSASCASGVHDRGLLKRKNTVAPSSLAAASLASQEVSPSGWGRPGSGESWRGRRVPPRGCEEAAPSSTELGRKNSSFSRTPVATIFSRVPAVKVPRNEPYKGQIVRLLPERWGNA